METETIAAILMGLMALAILIVLARLTLMLLVSSIHTTTGTKARPMKLLAKPWTSRRSA